MALGILRSASAVPAVENSLRTDKDSRVRSQSAIALGQIGEKSSLAPSVATVDKAGVIRFLYQGTFRGDRPSTTSSSKW